MRNPEQTRKLIVEKAMLLFNLKGYRSTSLSDITKITGITKGAIYGNFENKDAVAVASFEAAVEIVLSDLRKRIKSAKTAPDKLKAITGYYSDYAKNSPIDGGCPIINTAIEADDNYPMLRIKVVRVMGIIKDSIKKIINRGIQENQIKKDILVDEFALTFYAAIEGAILISRVEGDTETYSLVRKNLEKQIKEISI